MKNDPTINKMNRPGCLLNWLSVIRNRRIIKDVFLLVVMFLLVVWVIMLKVHLREYRLYEETQADINDQQSELIFEQQKDIKILKYELTKRQDNIATQAKMIKLCKSEIAKRHKISSDGILIIGELPPPEAIK